MYRLIASVVLLALLSGCCLCRDEAVRAKAEREKAAQAAKAKAEEAEKRKQEAEKAEKLRQDIKAAEEAAIKARCGPHWRSYEWTRKCRDMVRARLGGRDDANFSSLLDVAESQMPDKCIEFYGSTVTVKNAFGAKVKYRFRCSHIAQSNEVNLVMFEMDGIR